MCECTLCFNTCRDFRPDFSFCGSKHQHIVFSTVRRKESYLGGECEDLKTVVGFKVMMLLKCLRMQGRHVSPVLLLDFRF